MRHLFGLTGRGWVNPRSSMRPRLSRVVRRGPSGARGGQGVPLCRGDLVAGPEQLFDEAARRYFVVEARVERGETSWAALSAADQREMKEVVQMWKDAADLGIMYDEGQGVQQNYAEAVKWFLRGAEQGSADTQFNLGLMYFNG